MNQQEFEKMYLQKFEPDPQLAECEKFLRHATDEQIREARKNHRFPPEVFKYARKLNAMRED